MKIDETVKSVGWFVMPWKVHFPALRQTIGTDPASVIRQLGQAARALPERGSPGSEQELLWG